MHRIVSITFYIVVNVNHLFLLNISSSKVVNVDFKKPVITEFPKDLITNESILEFTCKATGNPSPSIVWYNASTSQPLEDKLHSSGYQTSIHVNKHLGKLMISNPIKGKSYYVYCNASNIFGWVVSDPPVIGAIIYLYSEFSVNPSDIEAVEGTSVTLECLPPNGLPKPQISWIKNNQMMINEDKVQNSHNPDLSNIRIMPDGSLRIHPASIKDTGNYICVATNPVGERLSKPAYLHIKSRDHKYLTPKHIRVRQGQQVKLVCPSIKNEPIRWSLKSKRLFNVSERIQQIKGDLIIKRALHSDTDVYVCTTLNDKENEISLTVETPPIFLKSPVDLTLNVGDKAKFLCVADGNPKPGIYWELPDRSPVFPTDNSSTQSTSNKYIIHTDGTLEINSITLNDAGKYHCIAHSSIDMIQTSAILRIKRKKKITASILYQNQNVNKLKADNRNPVVESSSNSVEYVPPYIGLPPSNKTQVIGESVLMDCELPRLVRIIYPNNLDHSHKQMFVIQSTESWKITWRRSLLSQTNRQQHNNNNEIINGEDNRFKIFHTGSLQINNLQINDSGKYTCLLTDQFNVKYEVTASLNVVYSKIKEEISYYLQEYPLSAPNNIHIMNITDHSVTLSWNPPLIHNPRNNHKSILSINYWIELYTPKKSNQGCSYCSLNPNNYHKSTGINEIYHRLELMKQIYHEEQENNITDSITSLPGVISTVTIEAHYTQNIRINQLSQPINHKVTSLLTELKPFRCYEIGIKAFHNKISMNYLETSDIFTHTALTYETSPISPPRNIFASWLLNDNLELGWTAPPISDWNGIILGYIVYIYDELLKTYHNVNVSSEGRKIVINLNSLPKSFSIQLAAYTCVGIGIRSESLKIDNEQKLTTILYNDKDLTTFMTTEHFQLTVDDISIDHSNRNEKLINQPWFISAIISSLLAWCMIFTMCLLCWIRRNKFCRKRITYQITQPNFHYNTTLGSGNCKLKMSSINDKSKYNATVQPNNFTNNHINNPSTTVSISSSEQTCETSKTHPHISYLSMKQPSENISNSSSTKSCGLHYTEYIDETQINSQNKLHQFHLLDKNEVNSVIPQLIHTFIKQFTPNSSRNLPYILNDNQDPIKTNSLHFTSASQTSSEPFDSAIYLEQISNRQHFNDSSISMLSPPTLMTTINDDITDNRNEQIYSPIVTPYATASIIQNQNYDRNHFNENTSQTMYITCMNLTDCSKAINTKCTGGITMQSH
ncbi:Protein sax-3 [Schistosoma japonicum]|uniref:Protein sax-3 n=1 Tax=Schistosoma japonicum TaxID=6182 RepID=A0A4Z2D8Q5_SCHJA|nr:Protein sax-3 [Schistosoma japonicum]